MSAMTGGAAGDSAGVPAREFLPEQPGKTAADPFHIFGMDVPESIAAEEFLGGIAEDPRDGGGDVFDRALGADQGDGVEAVSDEGPQTLVPALPHRPGIRFARGHQ